MVGVKVPISSGLDTKDDLHTRKGHAERGNLSVAQSTMPVTRQLVFISLDITPENTKVREKENSAWKLACDMARGLVHMKIVF